MDLFNTLEGLPIWWLKKFADRIMLYEHIMTSCNAVDQPLDQALNEGRILSECSSWFTNLLHNWKSHSLVSNCAEKKAPNRHKVMP